MTHSARQLELRTTDPVTTEIMRNALFATVRQASRIILRSSFSPIIRDAYDFCVTVIAPRRPPRLDLDVVAMSESLAHFSGVMPFLVRNLVWEYGFENLEDGDLIAINNPYKAGNHVYDNAFFKPVFYKGEMIAAVAVKAHLMDMGGSAAGGYSVEKRSIWEEGLVLSGVPIYKGNKPFKPGFNLYFDNSRLPENMLGDIQALFQACRFAEHRLLEMVSKYGKEAFLECMEYALDYAERSMRNKLIEFPDGEYVGEDGLDADAAIDAPLRIRCRIRKQGGHMEVDFSGTTRQAESSINCSAYDAANGVYTALKFIFDPNNPNNSGAFRCVDVVIPEGTIISALPPAPTTMYFDAAEAVFNAVVKALLPGLGARAFGGHFGTNMSLLVTGNDKNKGNKLFIAPLFALGGFGASTTGDGENFVSMSQQNIMDMSVEAIESDYPILVRRKEFTADTGGPGRYRGGAGVLWERIVLVDAEVRPLILHMRILPWGCEGGQTGRPGGAWMAPAPHPYYWLSEKHVSTLEPISGFYDVETGACRAPSEGQWFFGLRQLQASAGTLFRLLTPGAGGWGNPYERDPALVLKDVRDGFVTIDGARNDYGVVIEGDPDTSPEQLVLNETATRALREGSRSRRNVVARSPAQSIMVPEEREPGLDVNRIPVQVTCPACQGTDVKRYPILQVTGWKLVTRCQSCLHVLSMEEPPTPLGFRYVPYSVYLEEDRKATGIKREPKQA